jgi:hypothetical protein
MIVVANAGPLIALAQIGQFELLQKLYGQIRIPVAVQREVVASGGGRAGTEDVATSDWVSVVLVQDHAVVRLLRERLDAGESEAVALALELQADLLLIGGAWSSRGRDTRAQQNGCDRNTGGG